ncbi:MAG TPA: preprotein translocase subunit YajC [Lentisphaeria bacterium]|nr:preprotein translocase subunit YajC [Lentisphaerota bacterium]OQC14825.1 MAG: preprotein translocase subunit YajC [Lentisphaerae bacterium ADurb.Bin082]HPY89940.1 preprotein translocase subunit YajC [Lentisphaeria bacterium]HQL88647.1 preprotein translocase subunit YajC [Lentisphaeria bacterium]
MSLPESENLVEPFVSQFVVSIAQAAPPTGGGGLAPLLLMLPLLGIMYFLMYRPQQQKQKEHLEMLKKLKVGDRVMTTSGILGKITYVDPAEKTVRVEVAPRVEIEFVRNAVANILTDQVPTLETN